MSVTPVITRFTRLALAVLAIGLAGTAIAPAASHAAANNGGGPTSSDSEFCKTLFDRLKRFNDLANDASQPKNVREFYKARAVNVLDRARRAGCGWAALQSQAPTTAAVRGDAAATAAARTRKRTAFDRLTTARTQQKRSSKRRLTGGGTRVPSSTTTVAELKATTTGNQQQDEYCAGVAKLIEDAQAEGDRAMLNNDQASADAWYDLADYFIDQSTQNGCRFVFALVAQTNLERASTPVATRG
ncbi:MAG: hypothetical protein ACSLFR_03990 [Solirubrobacteraceae bacterium]